LIDEAPAVICRALEVAPPLPAPMLGQIRIVVSDTPLQFMASVAVMSVLADDNVSTLVKTTEEILKLQDCASAVDGASKARSNVSSRRIIGTPRR
jgi:hypothetical protein